VKLTGISLFSGAGGMDVGFANAGFNILWANDKDESACASYAANHSTKIICGDICSLIHSLQKFQGVDVVFGGPPCQGFSVAGKMKANDPRNSLIWSFMDAVKIVQPRAFILENVKALATINRWCDVREKLIQTSYDLGYNCKLLILTASDFGVPQARQRMFLIGFRDVKNLDKLEQLFEQYKCPAPTVKKILLNLGVAGSPHNQRICRAKITLASKPVLRRSPYAGMLFNGQGRPLKPNGYSSTLPASMGGNRTPIIDEEHCYYNGESWVEWYHGRLMDGEDPLPPNSAPKQLRRLTVDEVLRLQTFPHEYEFRGSQSSIYSQIGNAVPCKLAEVVASVVKDVLVSGEIPVAKIVRDNQENYTQLSLAI